VPVPPVALKAIVPFVPPQDGFVPVAVNVIAVGIVITMFLVA
jgi:hypothetical protein